MKSIAVYCGSSEGSDKNFMIKAHELGAAIAKQHLNLVYGGARVGLMGAVADGALSVGGTVTGVLPRFLAEKELQHMSLTETFLVDTMHQRKAMMSELADGFITLPGGFGTMEELFEMLTWAQLALHKKPLGLLNVDGYYDSLVQFVGDMSKNGFLKKEHADLLIVSDDIEDLLRRMKEFVPLKDEKWVVNTSH